MLLAAGCDGGSAAPRPSGLRDVPVPAGFDFATTREVVVEVRASEATLGASHGALEVALPTGQVIYRGPVAAAAPTVLHLPVPTKDAELLLRLGVSGGWRAASAGITDGAAVFQL